MKSWGKRMIALCLSGILLTGCRIGAEDEHVLSVKNIALNDKCQYSTMGEAFDAYFTSPTWKYYKGTKYGLDEDGDGEPDYTEDNIDIVEFTGRCIYKGSAEVDALMQFTLEEGEFKLSFLSLNELPQSEMVTALFLIDILGVDMVDLFITEDNETQDAPDETKTAEHIAETETAQENTSDVSEYIIPDSDTKEYLDKDIRDMDLTEEELRIARNEIYARHGRKFNDSALQAHFDACSWYKGTIEPDAFDENVLNDIEKFNIDSISAVEDMEFGTISKDWYFEYHNFYNAEMDSYLEIGWFDDGTIEVIVDGLTLDTVSSQSGKSYNGGLQYVCWNGLIFDYYPNHHHEINIENAGYDGVFYPN